MLGPGICARSRIAGQLIVSAVAALGHQGTWERSAFRSAVSPVWHAPRPGFVPIPALDSPISSRIISSGRGPTINTDCLTARGHTRVSNAARRVSMTMGSDVAGATSKATSSMPADRQERADAGNRGHQERRRRRSLQEDLNDVSFDFSLEGREPYVAGAPRRPGDNTGGAGEQGGTRNPRPALTRHSRYYRRKRPPSALCMPKHQRPKGCAPLLPIGNQAAVQDHIHTQQFARAGVSGFKSDLPCIQSGRCPLPAFRCPKGHVWSSQGNPVCFYCPVCADSRVTVLTTEKRKKRNLEAMQELAASRGGECIAKTYRGMHGKIRFRCAEGHEWRSTPSNLVYKKTWCPTCADLKRPVRKRLDVAEMQRTARQFGGEFLSTEYMGAAIKHEWKCHRGHRFWQAPNNIRRSAGGRRTATFCKICLTIDRSVIKSTVLGGLSPGEVERTAKELAEIGAMPTRRHFLPRRRKKDPRRPAAAPRSL